MEKQNKIIFEYERDLKEKSKVGKFAKTADIKTQRIKSSQSIGMFVKTKNKGKK